MRGLIALPERAAPTEFRLGQRDLMLTLITCAAGFGLNERTPPHAVTGPGAADTPGSSAQLAIAAAHTQVIKNPLELR